MITKKINKNTNSNQDNKNSNQINTNNHINTRRKLSIVKIQNDDDITLPGSCYVKNEAKVLFKKKNEKYDSNFICHYIIYSKND